MNNNNNNNNTNFIGDNSMRLSFNDKFSKCFDNNDITVHVKGKSLPINSFSHKRSKSTVIRNGLNISSQKHKMFKI